MQDTSPIGVSSQQEGVVMGLPPMGNMLAGGHTELLSLLLSRGANVDALSSKGTPLQTAASYGNEGAVKTLLDHCANPGLFFHHTFTPLLSAILAKSLRCVELLIEAGADTDAGSCGVTPLIAAASEGETEMIKLLLDAGADPNLTNDYGLAPIEIAALHANHQDVGILFLVTFPIPTYSDWSFGGIMRHAHSEEAKQQRQLKIKEKFLEVKSKGQEAFQKKDYQGAIYYYSKAIRSDPCDATVLSNRSLCWTRMQEGDRALSDAKACIKLRPDWPKAYYREGVAWNILKRYDRAADAFFEGLKLDAKNEELRKAFKLSLFTPHPSSTRIDMAYKYCNHTGSRGLIFVIKKRYSLMLWLDLTRCSKRETDAPRSLF